MWQDNIRKVTPYTPREQPKDKDVIKLNTNESPYPPSPMVQEVVRSVENNRNRLYPDPEAAVLTDAIAKYYNVELTDSDIQTIYNPAREAAGN